MLSFEHHVYFVNALIIIWLSHGGNLLVSLAIDPGNHEILSLTMTIFRTIIKG